VRRTHIAIIQDPDKNWGFDTIGDFQYNTTCSGVNGIRYWFEFPVTLDPIVVNGKILVPKDQIVMDDNKMWNDYVLIEEGEKGEGVVLKGKWKGRKVLFEGGVGIEFQSNIKYTKQDNVLWIE
jgi:hypothetical protein